MKYIEEYNEEPVKSLKLYLTQMTAKGYPKYFEVLVDGIRVINKTDNLDEYDQHAQWINDTTKSMRVMVYNTKNSHRSQVFEFRTQNYVDGVSDKLYVTRKRRLSEDEISDRVQQVVEARQKEQAFSDMESQTYELKKRLGDAETYIRKLEEELDDKKEGSDEFNFASMLNMASAMAQNNPELKMQRKNFGIDGFANINKEGEKAANAEHEEPTATFRRKTPGTQEAPIIKEETQPLEESELTIKVPNNRMNDEIGHKLIELAYFLSQNPEYIDMVHGLMKSEEQKLGG